MRKLHRVQVFAVCTFAVLFAFASMWLHLPITHAQTNGIWASGTAGTFNWDDPLNWLNGSVATAGGNADFNSVNALGDMTVNLAGVGRSVGNLSFGDLDATSAGGWTIGGENTLTLSGAPSSVKVNQLAAGKPRNDYCAAGRHVRDIKNGVGELALTNANGLSGGVTVNQRSRSTSPKVRWPTTSSIIPTRTLAGTTLNVKSGSGHEFANIQRDGHQCRLQRHRGRLRTGHDKSYAGHAQMVAL